MFIVTIVPKKLIILMSIATTVSTRFDKGDIKGRIKAYTWHDVLEYIKDNFFDDRIRGNLNINCEKDFAYLEEIATEQNITNSST